MRYQDAMDVIARGNPDEWVAVSGPIAWQQTVGTITRGDDLIGLDVKQHYGVACWREDMSLGLAYGRDDRHGDEEWAPQKWATFPDQSVHGLYIDVMWMGVPVRRELMVSVDGGRGLLPVPMPILKGDTVEGYEVNAWEVALARIVHRLAFSQHDFDRYLDQSKFIVRG